ncbi:uncharacterized protein LOC110700993 [Chenopodium quinoa]|uniref:Uncharacterized protein n=1 Tax=Chenopodium quinoa TaxID=63459 RepID=A0A803L3X1_CHEQI|nr:uncharacterized protein LOC110700993 [Chenopodium quinoa]
MDSVLLQPHQGLFLPQNLMNPFSLSSKLKLKPRTLFSKSLPFRIFCTTSQNLENPITEIPPNGKASANSKFNLQNLKQNWLSSLSNNEQIDGNGGFDWIIGIDPDVSGALALLKYDNSVCISAQVFDAPFVQISVGKTRRKRLDAKSIVQLLQSFDAPKGTTAYLEQSIPFPRDGKLGWWSGGFGYGLWIGVLVASGFSVVPVPSSSWKREFELARSTSSKDDSRELAARMFPDLTSMLKRKKDHGRAEALLIAAYGKGYKTKADELCMSDDTPEVLTKL